MKWKNNYVLIILALVFLFSIGYLYYEKPSAINVTVKQSTKNDEVHYHAAVHHYKDGVFQDYSDFKYMSVVPCGAEEVHDNAQKTEHVHLHDGNGEIVHVHIAGVVWQDFFDSIGIAIGENDMYIDGELSENGLEESIREYQRVLVIENSLDSVETKLNNLPSQSDIVEAELVSELCGS